MLRQTPKVKMDAYEAVFTALAHPVRRRILVAMHFGAGCTAPALPCRRRILVTMPFQARSMTAGEIAAMFEHAWPTTTGHLRVLESAGLLHHDREGRTRVYHLDRRRVELVRDWLAWFSKG